LNAGWILFFYTTSKRLKAQGTKRLEAGMLGGSEAINKGSRHTAQGVREIG
jgi:hypothetical protein